MNFCEIKEKLQQWFKAMTDDVDYLYEVSGDKDMLWELYLNSYPEGTNKMFRKRREHDCSCCRHFIKDIGLVVAIKDNKMISIWDAPIDDTTYKPVFKALSKYVHSQNVSEVYYSRDNFVGTDSNKEITETGEVLNWEHFYVKVPQKFVFNGRGSIESAKGNYRDTRNVFKRSLSELTEESVLTVLDLINQNSLYKGTEWKSVLTELLKYQREYNALSASKKELYTWSVAGKVGMVLGRIRNHSIGTLLINLSDNMDLETAVKKYEAVVAPSNYKRPNAIFTKKMLEDATKVLSEEGYLDALQRRHATLDDITVNNILFSNKDSAKRIVGAMDLLKSLEKDVVTKPKTFDRVDEISIEDFIKNVLPTTTEMSVYMENKHIKNLCSLVAPSVTDAKTMFKWDNGFSWAYTGNITDSDIKQNVKTAGGKVDGVLRFSIQWNDKGAYDGNDLDAHCTEPNGHEIFYGNKRDNRTTGELDIDIINPSRNQSAVENITWSNINSMDVGDYKFYVDVFTNRGGRSGFRAEIEFDGELYSYDYKESVTNKKKIQVAVVHFDGTHFTIKHMLPNNTSVSSKEAWGLKTNDFIPVSVMCYSPNYWDEQHGIGNKHYMFMLKDCINPENPNGMFNEFIKDDLMKHKHVLEALCNRMAVENCDDQLSGLGFSSTQHNDLVVKVKGNVERVVKIKF